MPVWPNAHANSNPNPCEYSDANTNCYCYCDCHRNINSDADTNSHTNTYFNAKSDADAKVGTNAETPSHSAAPPNAVKIVAVVHLISDAQSATPTIAAAAVIRVYDAASNVTETHKHKGDFKEP
jgi:hypothetical protein